MKRRAFLGACAAAALPAQTEKNTAELLGRSAQDKLLMVHADDAGMCHSANLATMEALGSGGVQSASVMAPCPWFGEMAEWARQHPEADLGIHLTLTSEWKHYRWPPVAPKDKVKGLLDAEGCLWRDVRSVATNATPAEAETELRAQIERARQFGVKFTHLDTHMGTLYARPDYFDVYTKLAREYGVPCMVPRPTVDLALQGYPITEAMIRARQSAGFVLLDRLATGVSGRTIAERDESYRKFLRELKPGVTKLIVHLAKDDAEIRAITGNWAQRWGDFQFWNGAESRRLMAELKIRPVTYRELGSIAYRTA
jgi:predicted glycoside hydrolase/deacetylase ChbG (UPF0249 family)